MVATAMFATFRGSMVVRVKSNFVSGLALPSPTQYPSPPEVCPISAVRNGTLRSDGMPLAPKRPRIVVGRRKETKSAKALVSSPTRGAAQVAWVVVPAATAALVTRRSVAAIMPS
ncbi:hypothetical protein D3C87_1584780 [compost metagenome]